MKKILLLIGMVWLALAGAGAVTYTWKGGASGAWSTSTNWNPERATPATDDVLVFDLGNRDGASSPGNITVNGVSDETIAQLQIIQSGALSSRILTLGNVANLTISGNLTINASCQLADGGSSLFIGGNFVSNANVTTTFHTGNGKIVFTNTNSTIQTVPTTIATATATITSNKVTALTITNAGAGYLNPPGVTFSGGGGTGAAATVTVTGGQITGYTITNQGSGYTSAPTVNIAYGGNMTFQNVEIGDGVNPANLTQGGAFQINGNLHLNNNATLSNNNKSIIFNSTNGVGGTVSGSGSVIFTATSGTLYIQGTGGITEQNVGTLNLNTASAANSTINSVQFKRPNSVFTFGTAYSNNVIVSGTITLDAGIFDDGGNIITVKGGTILAVSASPQTGIHRGTGKIQASRTNAGPLLVTAGTSVTVGNIEIATTSGVVTYAVGSGTNLTINGTLTLSKAGSVINASGSNITFQNANVPIALTAGTITTNASTTLSFGSTGNTGGAAFTIPNGLFTSAPTVGSINITRDNPLTLNNQAVSATTINVNAGSKLSLGAAVTTTNLNIKSNSSGTATLVDNGYSVSATNTTVEQYLSSARNFFISSPVTGATAAAGPSYWSYTEAGNNGSTWTPLSSGFTYTIGKGYVIRPTGSSTYTFTGSLNTGDKTITGLTSTASAKTGYNVVGNPYPSYVKWSEVTKTNVGQTMWYRTHDGSSYKFYTYNTVDGAGGIGVPATVTDYIPPMQAFWVKVNAGQTGELAFDNTKRYHQDVTGNALRAPKATASDLKMLRLQVLNAVVNDETVIYFNANASNTLDDYDSQKMFNNNPAVPEIYTTAGNEKLVINGLNELRNNTEIPLGFVTGQFNTFSIKATELKNIGVDTDVILRDKLNGVDYELTGDNAYSFTSDATDTSTRFSILFKTPGVTTGVSDNSTADVFAFVSAGCLTINCNQKPVAGARVSVFNNAGQLMLQKNLTASLTEIKSTFEKGMYMVKVENGNRSITKKVIL